MTSRTLPTTLVKVPQRPRRSPAGTLLHALTGVLLVPWYWSRAALLGVPGLTDRRQAFRLGLRALRQVCRTVSAYDTFHLLFRPMESTRYFEFEFTRTALAGVPFTRYLDVSSPRLLPVALLDEHPALIADFVNPNAEDLAATARLVQLIDATDRCTLHQCVATDLPHAPATFDVISMLSVLEHIPEDTAALTHLWCLLKPGGVLVLTVPAMASASQQYIERDEWGVLGSDSNEPVFWQRFYDLALLEERVYPVTGLPLRFEVYGERVPGALVRDSAHKRANPYYPYWREPYMMAREFRRYDQLGQLPGEGVAGLLFRKPA